MRRRIPAAVGLCAALLLSTATVPPAASAQTDWTPAATVGAADGRLILQPMVEVSADGSRATAIWINQDDDGPDRYFTASATITGGTAAWGSPTELGTGHQFHSALPAIALSADGRTAVAAWTAVAGNNVEVWTSSGRIEETSSTWGAPRLLAEDSVVPLRESPRLGLALSRDGTRATAAWNAKVGEKVAAKSASALIDGQHADWGAAHQVGQADTRLFQPSLALDAAGSRALLAWDACLEPCTGRGVWRSYTSVAEISGKDQVWRTPGLVGAGAVTHEMNPAVDLSEDGAAGIVTWTSMDVPDTGAAPTEILARVAALSPSTAEWSAQPAVLDAMDSPYPPLIANQALLSSDGSRAAAKWTVVLGESIETGTPLTAVATGTVAGTTSQWGTPADFPDIGAAVLAASGTGNDLLLSSMSSPSATSFAAGQRGPATTAPVEPVTTDSTVVAGRATGTESQWDSPHLLGSTASDLVVGSPWAAIAEDGVGATAVWESLVGITEVVGSMSASSRHLLPAPTPNPDPDPDPDPPARGTPSGSPTAPAAPPTAAPPSAGPAGQTRLRVVGRSKQKALRLAGWNRLVRSVYSDGRVRVRTACLVAGARVGRGKCGLVVVKTGPGGQRMQVRAPGKYRRVPVAVKAKPVCNQRLSVRVRISAKAASKKRATWNRTWRVGGDSLGCRARGNG